MEYLKKYGVLVLFTLITVGSVLTRSWHINSPVADWHSFRQADTASVARIYVERGIDLLHPRYHDHSNIQSGKDNPNGWRMVEFPLYQAMAAALARGIPSLPVEWYLRMITILSSTGTGLLLGIMVKKRLGTPAGAFAYAAYALMPYSIFYGRVILPDPFMVFLSVASLFVLDGDPAKRPLIRTLASGTLAAGAMLVKPQAAFLLIGALPLFLQKPVWKRDLLHIVLWGLLLSVPFLLWRMWIQQFPEGIPAFDWLLNKDNIRLKGAWFYWLFADRIGRLILGYWGLIPFGLGLIVSARREGMLFRFLILGALLYMVIIAGGNVQHDYYQIPLLPVLAIFVGKGMAWAWKKEEGKSRIAAIGLTFVSFAFMLSFSWYSVRSYYWINRPEIIEAGNAADQLLPKDAVVIAPYNGDTTFLYQTKRVGWPINFEIEKKISQGATHYVTVSPSDADLETKELSETYTVLVRNDRYAIIDLTKKKQ